MDRPAAGAQVGSGIAGKSLRAITADPPPPTLEGADMLDGLRAEGHIEVLRAGPVRRPLQGDPGQTCHKLLESRIKIAKTRPDGGQELAEIAGSTLHTVNHTLSAWDDRGVTSRSRRHIVVCKLHVLLDIADQGAD